MSESNLQSQDFTQGSIFNKLLKFMVPSLGALILQAMYGAVDLLIVGKFGTTAGISGVATGSSIMNLFIFVLCALTVGVTVLIGQYLGSKKTERIGALIGQSIAFYIVISVILSLVLVFSAYPIARLMQAPSESIDLTVEYIRICGGGFIFICFYNYISCIFRGIGNAKIPLYIIAIATVINIIGDLILIACFHMNVAGAAIATIAAQALSVVLSFFIIRKTPLPFSFKIKDIRFGIEILSFVKVGFPLALQEFLTNLTFLALCAFVNKIGLDASSGYGVAQKIQSFIMLIPSALMQSMGPFVAQNVGAKKEDRARKGMLCGMGIGCSIGVVIAVSLFLFGDSLSSIFTDDVNVISRSFEFLKGFAPEAVVTSILFSYMGYFNGHSKSLFVMAQGLLQSFIVRLPVSYIMSIQENASLTGIGLAAPSATVFGIILCLIYYKHLGKTIVRK